MLEWFQRLGVTDLYWSHATWAQTSIAGMRIHPFPLYPVQAMPHRPVPADGFSDRPYLYSFIGAYDADVYLTRVREWIFELPPRRDALVKATGQWHYESQVYGEQIYGQSRDAAEALRLARAGEEYVATLRRSVFSLCPSGSGPNSIRLWESLGFGCIPVILSDSLRLPGDADEWELATVRVPEDRDSVAAMPALLEEIALDPTRLAAMRKAGGRLWRRYGLNGPTTVLAELADRAKIREWVGLDRASD
jgi:hypothetical protein